MELKTIGLTKKFGSKTAVNALNITLTNGVYGLLGANGAGKTTLMRLLCNIQTPTSGKILLNGRNIVELGEKYRNLLGYLPQHFGYYPDFSAYDFLIYVSALKGLDEKAARKKSKELLEAVDLSRESKHKIKTFSGGMKQRLGIAIALVGKPDFILLDEPINGLDPEGIIEIRELILKLNKENGITFLISSHYLDELSKIATCYGFMDRGRIVKEISKKELEMNLKRRTQLKVNNIKECVKYLEETKIPYKIISDEIIDIYEKVNVTEIVSALSKRNCIVNDFQEKGETLESYYLNLIGGADND